MRGMLRSSAKLIVLGVGLAALAAAAETAGPPSTSQPRAYLLRNVRIWDGRGEEVSAGELLVVGNRIQSVSRGRIAPSPELHAVTIDGGGRVLTPGFIDAHVHMTSVLPRQQQQESDPVYIAALEIRGAEQALLRGFTTQRDVAGAVFGLKKAIDDGYAVGPRIYAAGAALSQTAGHGDDRHYTDPPKWLGGGLTYDERTGMSVIADGVPQVLAAAREQMGHGAAMIKVMASGGAASEFDPIEITEYTLDELKAAVDVAASFGTYVTVHSYNSASTRRAIEAGVRCIEHGHLIDEPTMKLIADRGIFLSTNIVVYEVPPVGISERQRAKFLQVQAATDAMMKLAKKYHVKLGFGTDLIYGLDNKARENREFTLRERWFSPVEILRQATSGNAELLAMSGPRNPYPGKLGVIEEGAYADVLLINGEPLKDITILEHPADALALIMKDGKIFKNQLAPASRGP
ncbi:MAG: amidohydrolase family protein [Gammaproteobacteria bacterium]|nr:MAG: amidohydrolase family protein [Gammaproteobacteria bacterium]